MPKSTDIDTVLVGVIQGAFGVHGEVRVKSFTADPAALFDYAPFLNEKGEVIFEIKSCREIKDGFAFYPKEAITREQAIALRNTKLYANRADFEELEEDEFYYVDLIGLRVESIDGKDLGKVKAVHSNFDDLLEVFETPEQTKSWYIPFTRENVPVVDIKNGKIICDLPYGLLPSEITDEDKPNPPKAKKQ